MWRCSCRGGYVECQAWMFCFIEHTRLRVDQSESCIVLLYKQEHGTLSCYCTIIPSRAEISRFYPNKYLQVSCLRTYFRVHHTPPYSTILYHTLPYTWSLAQHFQSLGPHFWSLGPHFRSLGPHFWSLGPHFWSLGPQFLSLGPHFCPSDHSFCPSDHTFCSLQKGNRFGTMGMAWERGCANYVKKLMEITNHKMGLKQ